MPRVPEELARKLRTAGQGHVLKFDDADKLSSSEAQELTCELEALDLQLLHNIVQASTQAQTAETGTIEPLESYDLLEQCSAEDKRRWVELGLEAVSRGQVCALVMGGGQGTRLGFAGPKGMYDMGLPSEKSLFQLFAERLLALEVLAAKKFPTRSRDEIQIPFYVMTSKMNHETTMGVFREHRFFGLKESQMFFFKQGTLPCFTTDGKLILENTHKLATASDGNGGIYKALEASGALAKLQARGLKYLHVFSVDNALCKAADPTFIGYCIDKQADCGNKVVWKARPDDCVGVVAKRNDRFCVIEYSEIDREMAERVDPRTGKLVFGAANICNHFYTIDFLVNVVLPNLSLEYHVAHKKIPMADDTGATYTPISNSGIKLESFIFDVFPLSSRMAVLSVPRETEFAPVKNPPGNPVDSPDSARRMLHDDGKAWLVAAASSIAQDAKEIDSFVNEKLDKAQRIEISPLVSYNGEGLETSVKSLMEGLPREIVRLESPNFMANANSIPASIRRAFTDAGQERVFRFVDSGIVTAHDACELVESLRGYDPAQLAGLFERSTKADSVVKGAVDEVTPLEERVVHQLSETAPELKTKWLDLGLEAVSKGMVGALVLSGGQGTRLGFAGPKGMYDIGLPSGKSLFEIFALRVLKVQELAQTRFNLGETPKIPLLIMTSEMNHEATVSFFRDNAYFGLSREQLHFFCQGTLPCFTEDGKFILETASQLARASDGNGGIYPALKRSGLLDLLSKRNVQYLHVFSVDNVLCKVADPVFIGYCVDQDADCANKVVWNTRPEESVGVVAKRNGAYCVVEYSELDRAASEQVDPSTGKLSFGAANICNHFFRLDFLQRCCNQSDAEYHVAKKKIPYVNDEGTATITPTSNTGIKLETFIFDVFPLSKSMKVLGVAREDEFASVKNAAGAASDSPDTARQLISEQCKRWLVKAGATFADNDPGAICEVLPTLSYNGEGLEEVARSKSPIQLPIVLGCD
ncbi:UDP-N-acetylhexosamine pyrophosphorylase-like protein 1 [Phytophthora fragariae]|uniref:UDP-N-acetylglucosamine diphosphorylase n=1 Tax=Phytophthora fragariae TaxID=53985 RepID=A0A6A4E245_9STRA|nr:UDP-N-acetylhexosamine pyrophosphorylase-like protein 1 [Phytophthora fragariae]KAE8942872.1 UDP-N-acetylhexosamine pyrophosphorylase-like protein 1 [Phytophthora fragariae]KAE9020157.1 UDP-N-acetylhexosamine pyrophosphorylase-like protein 1 [Phytophthora fragariae]KAE9124988.1 UDP-N-acetylhexosamine pyrophosphorylase-like protein 1 [Phytophthora fragariae]KAE9125286.1 UDP-N-acetylhexosamine pyrophosphorylase-like protein 1 [Phytophthora fragariae]